MRALAVYSPPSLRSYDDKLPESRRKKTRETKCTRSPCTYLPWPHSDNNHFIHCLCAGRWRTLTTFHLRFNSPTSYTFYISSGNYASRKDLSSRTREYWNHRSVSIRSHKWNVTYRLETLNYRDIACPESNAFSSCLYLTCCIYSYLRRAKIMKIYFLRSFWDNLCTFKSCSLKWRKIYSSELYLSCKIWLCASYI